MAGNFFAVIDGALLRVSNRLEQVPEYPDDVDKPIIRSTEARLRPYTTPLDRLNLALLVVLGALSAAVAIS